MNIWPFFHKPEPISDIPLRGISGRFTTSPATRERSSRMTDVQLELAVYVATTTPEQRRAETADYWAMSRIASRFAPEKGRAA